jgi:hypothetical protein
VIPLPRLGAAVLVLTAFGMVALVWRSCQTTPPVETRVTAGLAGPPQTVFDWSSEACAPDEFPDLPVRAYRDDRGRVHLILPHFNTWRLSGPDLNHLGNPCEVVMRSSLDRAPADFNQTELVASLYTDDGRRIAALVHEEYHGTEPGACVPNEPTSCWYNAVTLARSEDGGRSFHQPPPPDHFVGASVYRYSPGVAPTGIFSPSNIVPGPDGYSYAVVVSRLPRGTIESCLIRTDDPFEHSSWRAWDGSGFGIRFSDPYGVSSGAARPCAPIATREIAALHESLTYNTYLDRYLLVGLTSQPPPAAPALATPAVPKSSRERATGVYFSLSSDLIHWSPRRLIMEATSVQTFRCGGPNPIAYPSLIDPRSNSRTFATTGRRPYLYYTRFNYEGCQRTMDRDLVRRRIELSRSEG